jgi:cytochrome c peroxidase
MRFSPEAKWGANAGLAIARERLEAVKAKHAGLSYADLYSLAGVVAIQEMGGPAIPWRGGRADFVDGATSPPDGRLPDAGKKGAHLRDIFGRMGFSDGEIVALSGAHALGRCHADRSGFVGPWTRAPTTFSNEYFRLLLEEEWVPKTEEAGAPWKGPAQFTDATTRSLMMLPSDLALVEDATFKGCGGRRGWGWWGWGWGWVVGVGAGEGYVGARDAAPPASARCQGSRDLLLLPPSSLRPARPAPPQLRR